MGTLASLVVKMSADVSKFQSDMGRAGKIADAKSKRIKKSLTGATKSMAKSLATGMGVVGFTAIIAKSVTAAKEFETAMSEVETLLDDTSEVDNMKDAMARLSVEFGSSQTAQAKALYQAISAGAEAGEEAIDLLTAANKLSVGGVTDVETAVDGLTTVMNAYGDDAGTAAEVSDVFFTAVKAGKTTIPELASAIGKVGPIAGQMGVSFIDTAAATATLTKSGVSTAEAITGLRGVLSAVAKPAGEAAKMAEELGLEFSSTALESQGLAGFLDSVKTATGGNIDKMSKLFGSVEALGTVMNLTGGGAEDFNQILIDMESATGASDAAFAKMAETAEFKFGQMRAAGEASMIALGDQVLTGLVPTMDMLIGSFVDTADGANFAASAGEFLVDAFNVLMSAGIVVKNLFESIGIVIGNFAGIVIEVFNGIWDTITAFVGGVGTAFTLLKEGEFKKAGEAMGNIAGGMSDAFTIAGDNILASMSAITEGVTGEFTDGLESLDKVWGANVDTMEDRVKPALESTAVELRKTVAAAQEFEAGAMTLDDELQEVVVTAEKLPVAFSETAGGIEDSTTQIAETTTGMAAVIENTFKRLDDTFASFWSNLLKDGKFSLSGIKDLFLDTIAQMLHAAITQPIVMRFGTMMTGGLISGGAAAAGGGLMGGGGGGLMGLLGLLGSPLGGAVSGGLLGSLFGGQGAIGGALGGTLGSMFGGGIGASLVGAFSSSAFGSAVAGSIGASTFTAIASVVAPVIGTLIGVLLGGLIGSLFGSKPRIRAGGSAGVFGGGARDTQFFDSMFGGVLVGKTKGGMDKHVQEFGEAIVEFDNALAQFMSAGQLDKIVDALASWRHDMEGKAIEIEDLFESRFAVILSTFGDNVQSYVNQFEGLEEQADALSRYVTAMNQAGAALSAFIGSDVSQDLADLLEGAPDSVTGLRNIGEALSAAMSEFDNTPEALQRIAELSSARYQAELEFLAAIEVLVRGITQSIADQQAAIRGIMAGDPDGGGAPDRTFREVMIEARRLRGMLSEAESPEEIARIVAMIQELTGTSFGGLSEAMQGRVGDMLIAFLDTVQAAAIAQAEALAAAMEISGDELRLQAEAFAAAFEIPLIPLVDATDNVSTAVTAGTDRVVDKLDDLQRSTEAGNAETAALALAFQRWSDAAPRGAMP